MYAKIQQQFQKRLKHIVYLIGIIKEHFIMPKTFVFTDITVRKPMRVERLFYVESNVLLVQPATRPVPILSVNVATD